MAPKSFGATSGSSAKPGAQSRSLTPSGRKLDATAGSAQSRSASAQSKARARAQAEGAAVTAAKAKGPPKSKAVLDRERRELEKAAGRDPKRREEERRRAESDEEWEKQEHEQTLLGQAEKMAKGAMSKLDEVNPQVQLRLKEEGMALWNELLSQESQPAQVADWFLTQLKKLGKPGTSKGIQNVPLFKLASALNTAKDWQRQRLAKISITGFASLPADKRARILGLVVESAPAMLPEAAGEDAHVTNLRAVIRAARFDKLQDDERASLKQTVQSEAIQLANPKHLSDVLSKLPHADRKKLPDSLVRTKLVAPENRDFIEDAVRPDGMVDEAGQAVTAMDSAREYYWVLIVLPLAEGLFAAYSDQSPCAADLVFWLQVDAALSAALVIFAIVAMKLLGPAYDRISGDLSGAARRWRTAEQKAQENSSDQGDAAATAGEPNVETKLIQAAQLDVLTLRTAFVVLGISLLLAVAGSAWSALGTWELVQATLDECLSVTVLFISTVVALRFAATVFIFYVACRIWDVIQRHKRHGNDADAGNYGSV